MELWSTGQEAKLAALLGSGWGTKGLKLLCLPPEVKDGFLALVLPILRSKRGDLDIKVHFPVLHR